LRISDARTPRNKDQKVVFFTPKIHPLIRENPRRLTK
jgi:hypothetical protein